MKCFVHYDDNEDGTITASICFDGENTMTMLIDIPFIDFLAICVGLSTPEMAELANKHSVVIPDDPEGA